VLVLLVGSAIFAFTAYRFRDTPFLAHLQAPEKRIVGVWEWTTIDAVGRMKIHPDHRYEMWFVETKRDEDHPNPEYVMHGQWRIEGQEFIYIEDPNPLTGRVFAAQRGPLADFGPYTKRVR
jgi:hypothetical protein